MRQNSFGFSLSTGYAISGGIMAPVRLSWVWLCPMSFGGKVKQIVSTRLSLWRGGQMIILSNIDASSSLMRLTLFWMPVLGLKMLRKLGSGICGSGISLWCCRLCWRLMCGFGRLLFSVYLCWVRCSGLIAGKWMTALVNIRAFFISGAHLIFLVLTILSTLLSLRILKLSSV